MPSPISESTATCGYINRLGVACTRTPKSGDRCAQHRANLPTQPCLFPDCPRYTYSKTGLCNFHHRPSPHKDLEGLVSTPTPELDCFTTCTYIMKNGDTCGRQTKAAGKCPQHYGARERMHCSKEGCTNLTMSRFGRCVAHRLGRKEEYDISPPKF